MLFPFHLKLFDSAVDGFDCPDKISNYFRVIDVLPVFEAVSCVCLAPNPPITAIRDCLYFLRYKAMMDSLRMLLKAISDRIKTKHSSKGFHV